MERFERAGRAMDRLELFLIVLFLTLMIIMAVVQILLRNIFSTGINWGDSLVRSLVLWIGFIGAAMAAKQGKHINIDLIPRWMPPGGRKAAETATHLFTSVTCGLLAYAAVKFIKNEAQMGTAAFLGIPAWAPELILPVTFGLMALRFLLRCFGSPASGD